MSNAHSIDKDQEESALDPNFLMSATGYAEQTPEQKRKDEFFAKIVRAARAKEAARSFRP